MTTDNSQFHGINCSCNYTINNKAFKESCPNTRIAELSVYAISTCKLVGYCFFKEEFCVGKGNSIQKLSENLNLEDYLQLMKLVNQYDIKLKK